MRRNFIEFGSIGNIGDEGAGLRGIHAISDVLGRELRGAGRKDHAHADAGRDDFPPFEIAPEHQHDGVAAFDAGLGQAIGELTGPITYFGESALLLVAIVIHPPQREIGRVLRRPLVNHITREVETGRWRPLKAGTGLFVTLGSGCGVAHDGALKKFKTSFHRWRDRCRRNVRAVRSVPLPWAIHNGRNTGTH